MDVPIWLYLSIIHPSQLFVDTRRATIMVAAGVTRVATFPWELGQGWHVHGASRIGRLGAGCPQGGLLILLVAPGPSRPVPWGLASMRAEAEAVKAGRSLKD